jgi:GNAT superfamily N-acetyltransferase
MRSVRQVKVREYAPVIQVIDDWFGGRPQAGKRHRLFFEHFQPTSFVIEEQAEIVGFLVGFRSQTTPAQAYSHFVGVHPALRGQGIGRRLCEQRFAVVCQLGCTEAHASTAPVNSGSLAFHARIGFVMLPADAELDGLAVMSNYDGRGTERVRFRRDLYHQGAFQSAFQSASSSRRHSSLRDQQEYETDVFERERQQYQAR